MRTQRYLFFILFILNVGFTPLIAQTTNDSLLDFIERGMLSSQRYRPKDSIGAIGLPYSYTSPCPANSDLFTELYYWDAFFVNRYYWLPKAYARPTIRSYHLESDTSRRSFDKDEIFDAANVAFVNALNNVNNLLYLVDQYGFVPNANRYSMLNRSQLPLLSEMVLDITMNYGDVNWLANAVIQLEKEYNFWMVNRSVEVKLAGKNYVLNRFGNQANARQLNGFYQFLKHRLKTEKQEDFSWQSTDSLLFASQLLSEAESGWDFTPRFQGRCMDYLPVDLNAALGKMELNMVYFYSLLYASESDTYTKKLYESRLQFFENARKSREKAMNLCMWNGKQQLYLDYNWKTQSQSEIFTAASLWPGYLQVGKRQSKRSYENMKRQLILNGLVIPIAPKNSITMPYVCQWDSPNAWAPLQILGYEVLNKSELPLYRGLAADIRTYWLKLVVEDWRKFGILKEKYSCPEAELSGVQIPSEQRSVKQEGYGNPPMMGWTAAATFFLLQTP